MDEMSINAKDAKQLAQIYTTINNSNNDLHQDLSYEIIQACIEGRNRLETRITLLPSEHGSNIAILCRNTLEKLGYEIEAIYSPLGSNYVYVTISW